MRILKLILGFSTALVICYFGFIIFIGGIENYVNRTDFNSEDWKNWEETEMTASLRWDMTQSLTKNYHLKGMTTEEIIELLGLPSDQNESNMRYYLGMARHGIDIGSLILEFEDGVVIEYRIWHG